MTDHISEVGNSPSEVHALRIQNNRIPVLKPCVMPFQGQLLAYPLSRGMHVDPLSLMLKEPFMLNDNKILAQIGPALVSDEFCLLPGMA